ncbi:MAG: ribonucleoside-triphosphate reductase, adenosylcobalamin-dependent [Gloeomargaritaceae cyanobacterium C42_A2020_066]|nr:ribonucleoside-triphosphate reductase, adenosylcobalamin-dependent [Gloeomargaritaceae cyanobacterium C42_A2020_066]
MTATPTDVRPTVIPSFPETAPCAYPVFFRTYSRRGLHPEQGLNHRESWAEVCDRTVGAIAQVGHFSADEQSLVLRMQQQLKALTSGRWLWVGGTAWITQPHNFSGAYNCTSQRILDWRAFGLMMDLAMMGCGTGAVLEPHYIVQLPPIRNRLNLAVTGQPGDIPADQRIEETQITTASDGAVEIQVGDSRQGWVSAYRSLLELASDPERPRDMTVTVNLSHVRPKGEVLKGFGGIANPALLGQLFPKVARRLNQAAGRPLTPLECCLLIDEAAATVVAGNIRRSAGMRQFSAEDGEASGAKQNLWQQDDQGNWRIDPEKDVLRMANHTRVFHRKPTLEECVEAVRLQFYSGEGAIQWAGEAVARSNADLLTTPDQKHQFLEAYGQGEALTFFRTLNPQMSEQELSHRLGRYGLNPCGEILGTDFHCNLSEIHLNQINPEDDKAQEDAFKAGSLSVAALLHHQFVEPRFQYSRALDPIVGVSFTGLFDFFVQAFGAGWLRWWAAGRPATTEGLRYKAQEAAYLSRWREIVHQTVWDYCDRHGLQRPNRCTTVQPAGTKSLLTGASPGWHPPKAQRYIRRITFAKNDPVALACMDYGYSVVPGQSDRDEQGHLLTDPFSEQCTEWLVEIPVAVPWAAIADEAGLEIGDFSALAQFDFYMQVQRHYTTHNTSATIELRDAEVEALAGRIHEAIAKDEGYISAALLARFDDHQTFPRLPFEPIDAATYAQLHQAVLRRRKSHDFGALLRCYDSPALELSPQDAACEGVACELKGNAPITPET